MSEKAQCAECQQPADLICTGCRMVSYCNKEHQKQHWKEHKSVCRPIEIKNIPDVGRCLIATRDINPGDLILSEYPLVYGPRPHMVEEGPVPCPGCCRLIIANQAPRCPGCDWPVCHEGCIGLRDPDRHANECFILSLRTHKALDGLHEYYRQDTLLVLRCLLLQRKGIKKWNQLLEMQAHIEKRGPSTEVHKDVEKRVIGFLRENFFGKLHDLETKANQVVLPDISSDTIHQLCGIIDVNSLEINQDAEVSALYPTAYLMEHNCVCNTIHTFDGQEEQFKITVRASVPIKKGEHITTMYTHALWGTQARREHLKETKYFTCQCKRCCDPTELGTNLSALRCLGTEETPCGGVQLPIDPLKEDTEWTCNKCPAKLDNNEVSYLINQIGEEVDYIQLGNPTVIELDGLLSKLLNFLHPNHYHCYAIKHSLVQLYGYQQGYMPNQISDELLKKKSTICRELLEVTRIIDPGNARLALYSGVLLHELHLSNMILIKRKWNIEKHEDNVQLLKEADDALKQAKEVLQKETSNVSGEKLFNLLASSDKDMRRWMDRYKIDLDKETAKLNLNSVETKSDSNQSQTVNDTVIKKEVTDTNKEAVKDAKKEDGNLEK